MPKLVGEIVVNKVFFLYPYHLRDSIALSISKSLIKSTWMNESSRFQAPKEIT